MIQFAGIAVLVVMLIIGLIITISTMIGYVICYKHAKQKEERIRLWIRIVLRSVFIIGDTKGITFISANAGESWEPRIDE